MRTILLSLAIGFLIANTCVAANSCGSPACCDRTHESCGRCGVQKTCKVICETKKVKKTTWVVECEEFCAPLPGCRSSCKSACGNGCGSGSGCDSGCDNGCSSDPCASLRRPIVPPKCGKVRTRKKLVKKEITCEVPVYKCVVVCCNAGCNAGCGEAASAEATVSEEKATRAAPPPIPYLSSMQRYKFGRR